MSFARQNLLPLALVIPLALAILVAAHARRARRVAALLGEAPTIARLGGARLLRFPVARLLLISASGLALALAAIGPRWGRRVVEGESQAFNIVLALDVSKSMLARDIAPSRLERERLLVRRLLRDLGGDRFGLVAFAGRAYVLAPVTIDHSAIELYLDALDPGIVSQGGSSLQSALLQATDLARGVEGAAGDRTIVLISDGEALEDEDGILQAAERAAAAGVRVFTIGVATAAGAPVPELDSGTGSIVGYKRDETGAPVHSRLGEGLLRAIAERTDGEYLNVLDGDAVERLTGALGRLERGAAGNEQRTEPVERFAWFLLLALLLLATDTVLARRGTAGPAAASRALAMVLMAGLFVGFGIGDTERGNRLYRAGRYAEAAAAYREALSSGRRSPELHYNLGTALLRLGRFDEAEQQFRAALSTVDPAVRERALYNLGNRFLLEGRQGGPEQAAKLQAAVDAYRQALRIEPGDTQAKWNLELALREQEKQQQQQQQQQSQSQQEQSDQPQQGGGGGGSQQQSTGEQGERGSAQEQRPMSESEAERILSAAEQDERDLAREKLRQGQRRSPVIRDW